MKTDTTSVLIVENKKGGDDKRETGMTKEGSKHLMNEPEKEVIQGNEIDTPMKRIDIIEETLLREDVLGFNPMVLFVLDDPNASQKEIENLKTKLGPDIFNHLFSIANSAYHGSLKMGPVQHFFDVVTRLGMEHTKVAILLFAMHRLFRGDMETELLYAKSFAASVVGRILATGLGFRDDAARKIELGCLLFHIGSLMMLVYRNCHQDADFHVDADFIQKYQSSLAERILQRFQLPDYLFEMMIARGFSLARMGIDVSGVVQMAIATVEMSFQRFNNRLVVLTPMLSSDDDGAITIGAIIEEQFAAAGFRKYLQVVVNPSQIPERNTT